MKFNQNYQITLETNMISTKENPYKCLNNKNTKITSSTCLQIQISISMNHEHKQDTEDMAKFWFKSKKEKEAESTTIAK